MSCHIGVNQLTSTALPGGSHKWVKPIKLSEKCVSLQCASHSTAHYGNEGQQLSKKGFLTHLEPAVFLDVVNSIFLVSNSLNRVLFAESLHQCYSRPEIEPFRFFGLVFLKCLTFLLKLNHPQSSLKCCYHFQTWVTVTVTLMSWMSWCNRLRHWMTWQRIRN